MESQYFIAEPSFICADLRSKHNNRKISKDSVSIEVWVTQSVSINKTKRSEPKVLLTAYNF